MDDENNSGVNDTPRGQEDDQSLHVLQEQLAVQQHEEGLSIREVDQEDELLQADSVEENSSHENQRPMTSDPSVDLLLEDDFLGSDDRRQNDREEEENTVREYNEGAGIAAADANNHGFIAASASNEDDSYSELALLGELLVGNYAQHSHGSVDESSDSDRESRRSVNGSNSPDDNVDAPQPAKNHPYLPTAQPLFPEEWITAGKHIQRLNGDDRNGFAEEDLDAEANECNMSELSNIKLAPLAMFEMDGIVLFPGATLPLRLRDRNWVAYLGALIDDARGLYGSHQGTAGRMGEVRMVILPHVTPGTRHTGRRRPREGRGRTGRWRVDLIRRGVTALRSRVRRHTSERIETDMGHQPSRAETDDMRVVQDGAGLDIARGNSHLQNQSSEQSSDEESESGIFRPTVRPASGGDDPLIGRIGTLATVTFTHEETIPSRGTPRGHRSSSLVNGGEELVLTVFGTQRCRVIRPANDVKNQHLVPVYDVEAIDDCSATLPPAWMMQPPGNARCSITTLTANASLVYEEEGNHSELVSSRRGLHGDGLNNAVRNLAFRSSTPAIAYQSLWPWRLCQKICNLVQEDQFEGLRAILPLAAGLCHEGNGDMLGTPTNETSTASSVQVLDPSAFSNWISSNMPLSQDDRLDLLEMTCTVQQLTYIIQKLEDKQLESILRCKWCGAAISQIRHVFSVGGSAGTTGAYVNEHGVVHQTVTLRKIDGNVVCVGRPETRESWFPGYNWQVAHCSICAEHLGWKFRRVGGENDDDLPDRPGSFWGFSSITTDEHVRPRRVSLHSHHRRALGVFPQFG